MILDPNGPDNVDLFSSLIFSFSDHIKDQIIIPSLLFTLSPNMTQLSTDYDWSDVQSVPYYAGENPVAQIMYSNKYEKATGLLRALMQKPEYSARGLSITSDVINLNPAHYTAWEFRYQTLKYLQLKNEAPFPDNSLLFQDKRMIAPENGEWINEMTLNNPKNYQVWNYRQLLAVDDSEEYLTGEALAVSVILEDDEKNFHAWSHYKWVLEHFSTSLALESELKRAFRFCETMLDADVRNNSAWSFRFFLWAVLKPLDLQDEKHFSEEINFVKQKIELAPSNEAVWNYLVGIYDKFRSHDKLVETVSLCTEYEDKSNRALELLADIYETSDNKGMALETYDKLLERAPMRKGFWTYRKNRLTKISHDE